MALVAPSILSADFARLAQELDTVSTADWVHVDVMDGRFVPNITIGPMIVEATRRSTELVVDTHLMIVEPDRFVDDFKGAGTDVLTVHAEACTHLHRCIQAIKAPMADGKVVRAGVSLNPHTPETVLDYVLDELDLVLVMTVNPGFGGQSFIDAVLPKIERLRATIDRRGLGTLIEVDGGVKTHNAQRVVDAGADVLVSGSGVFKASNRAAAIAALQACRRPGPQPVWPPTQDRPDADKPWHE